MSLLREKVQQWGQSNQLWSVLFLLAFAVVTWMAIRSSILTQRHQQEFTQQQTRRSMQQFVEVWEQGVDAQIDFWLQELNTQNLSNLESQWQSTTPWLDGIYIWSPESTLYPPSPEGFDTAPCIQSSPEWMDCNGETLDIINRASLLKANYWLQQDDLSQAQFAILSARPRIQAPISTLDLTDIGKMEFILRQIRLYQTEQLGAPLNGGQSLLGASLLFARQLPPSLLDQLLTEIPHTINTELSAQITRLKRHNVGWQAVQQLMKDKPSNKDISIFTSSSIESEIVVIHRHQDDGSHVAITLDVPTLILTFLNSTKGFTPALLNQTDIPNQQSLSMVGGSKYFSHLRIGLPKIDETDNFQAQLLLTMSPIILAGALGIFALIGSARADRQQTEFMERQEAFIARVTHELKTPLAGIKLMSESLQMSIDLPDESAVFIEKILNESERLDQRIDEILNVAKRAVLGRPTRVDTEIWMLELYDQWNPRFQEVNGTLRLELLSKEVILDKELLHDAISNLLSNTLKYRHPNRKLRCIFSMKSIGRSLEISVSDNGIGIPSPERKRVFDRFVRIEGNHRGFAGGHGLGLAFVAEAAQAHNGTAKCLDGLNGGCKILLRIPEKSA